MQVDNKILDDLARVAGGALGALSSLREEAEAQMRQQFERVLSRMDVVSREEYEAVRAMAAKAREEQETLADRVTALEATVATLLAERTLLHEEAAPRRRAPGQTGKAGEDSGKTGEGKAGEGNTGEQGGAAI
ncbi:accessory factor UbiK family protein [Azospirillum soli]|uniref:accessory factor UbiK family protein n=1 Tax=Azospirillum soli TaxID=1304799 RepID=UPI001FEB7F1F|nr:accessory factor UbiK family protein [Azospirillum soli]MBP2311995.1 BMFP domain-containing protein YqiC [Azospirillum soli]